METIRTAAEFRAKLGDASCVLVPTMGALHEGHLALARVGQTVAAERRCPLAVSIFVNPAQFNDPADLARYPRPLEHDLALLGELGVDVAFAPDVQEIYPQTDRDAAPEVDVPPVGRCPALEDSSRPGHFAGVCRVVSRLFDLCTPSAAVFGEKDWQQTRVVKAMCEQQGRSIEILVGQTVRESDGLAMSSRNQHLTREARSRAIGIWRGFQAARAESRPDAAERALAREMASAGFDIEYATIRCAESLMPTTGNDQRPLRILAAGVLDGVRLLDNAPWPA